MKNTIGPHMVDWRKLPEFLFRVFHRYRGQPLAAPLELAQQLVFGAVEYARDLGSSLILTTRRAPGILANGRGQA